MSPLRLYNVLLLLAGLLVAPFAGLIALFRPAWRRGLAARFGLGWPRRSGRPLLWAHAASVGEVEGIAPLVRRWRARNPGGEVVLSSLTATGCDTARRLVPEAVVRTFPFDAPWIAGRVVRRLEPGLFLFSENELWPNALAALARDAVPIIQVSGRLSQRAAGTLARFPGFTRGLLDRVTRFCVQADEHRARLLALGVAPERVVVTGSLKGDDRAPDVASFVRSLAALGRPVIVGGSTHAGEEVALLDAMTHLSRLEAPMLVLAPRHPERFEAVAGLLGRRSVRSLRRTHLPDDERATSAALAAADVLLLDSLGELAGCYAAASVAFIGGTLLPIGGHNLLEAARAGVPVVVGPHFENVRAVAGRLLEAGGGAVVEDASQLAQAIERFLDPELGAAARRAARRVALDEAGSLEATWAAIEPFVGGAAASSGEAHAGRCARALAQTGAPLA